MWLSKLLEGGGTAVLIFAVWWITTKLNERRQDKLLTTIETERENGQRLAKEDREAFTKSIEHVTESLIAEIHTERERVMKAHERDSDADRTALEKLARSIEILVGKLADQRVDDVKTHEAIKALTKTLERIEHVITGRGGL